MTEAQALAALTAVCDRVQSAVDHRPKGFVAVAIDVADLDTLIAIVRVGIIHAAQTHWDKTINA